RGLKRPLRFRARLSLESRASADVPRACPPTTPSTPAPLFYQGISFFRPFLCLLVDSLLLSTFFLSAAFCASAADCGSLPVAGVDVAVLTPDVPLSLALVGGGTESVAGGADVDVLDDVVAGSGGAVPVEPVVELLVGGGVADSGETV